MKNTPYRNNLSFLLVAISPLLLSACGGGGGDAPAATTPPVIVPPTPLPVKTDQTITPFTVQKSKVGVSQTVSATASSGLPVTFSSDTPSTCSVTPAGVVTGAGYGICTVAANQFGNDTYRQLTIRASALIVGAQTLSLVIPKLIVGETIPVTGGATSGLPVIYTSNTPSVCTVADGVVTVVSAVPADCTITVSQDGVTDFSAPATPVSATAHVYAAHSLTADAAYPQRTLPQEGSTDKQPAGIIEGIYTSATGIAIVDQRKGLTYHDKLGTLFGLLTTGAAGTGPWTLDTTVSTYIDAAGVATLHATGKGTLLTKNSFNVTEASFGTDPALPLNLAFSADNQYAIKVTPNVITPAKAAVPATSTTPEIPAVPKKLEDVMTLKGSWFSNTATTRTQLTIDAAGKINGAVFTLNPTGLPSRCTLYGTLTSSDDGTAHNLFDAVIQAYTDKSTGTTCNLNSNIYQGHAVMRFNAVTGNPANGTVQNLFVPTINFSDKSVLFDLHRETPF
jgi:hypothetical protein